MSRLRFAFLSVFVLVSLGILVSLGTWQLQRLHWKEALIDNIEAGLAAEPQPLPSQLTMDREFQRFTVTGRYLHDLERHIYRSGPRGAVGYHVLTPFEAEDGRVFFVNRGWVAEGLKDPAQRLEGRLEDVQQLTGVLRFQQEKPRWGSGYLGDEDANIFYLFWPTELGQTIDLDVEPYYLAADDSPNPGGWPQGGVTQVNLPNNHLQYALTWYGLGMTLIGVYLVVVYRRFKARI